MKPPPRKRTKTNPSLPHAPNASSEPKRVSHWTRAEQQRLLRALRRLDKDEEVDYGLLTRSVRSRSCSEVRAAVESLKDKVIALASSELKRRRWEDKRAGAALEVWTSLASTVAGTAQDSISTAFSQMLIVSSIEPRTLANCQPPHSHTPSDGHPGGAGDPGPVPRSAVRGSLPVATGPKGKVLLPQQRPLTPGAEPVIPTSAAAPSPSPPAVDGGCGPTDSPQQPSKDPQSTSTGVSSSVDFEKIYRFLQKPSDGGHLTAMEGAVVLDLLMSLPEELPHLNCRKLREHLIKVFQCLTSPADSSDPSELFRSLRGVVSGQRGAAAAAAAAAAAGPPPPGGPAPGDITDRSTQPGGAESQSAASCQSPCSQSGGSAAADVYPPLNPFLLPPELLRRR